MWFVKEPDQLVVAVGRCVCGPQARRRHHELRAEIMPFVRRVIPVSIDGGCPSRGCAAATSTKGCRGVHLHGVHARAIGHGEHKGEPSGRRRTLRWLRLAAPMRNHLVQRVVVHVPVELVRALADPRRRVAAVDRSDFAAANGDGFLPYARDERLARPWAVPGTPGLVHRIGGLEREDVTGNISYDPENHERMTHLRRDEGGRDRRGHPAARGGRPRRRRRAAGARVGSTLGTIRAAAAAGARGRAEGRRRAPAPPEPVPREHRRGRAALPEGADPRDEPRPARDADPGPVPGGRGGRHQGPGPADLRRRDRRGDPGGAR